MRLTLPIPKDENFRLQRLKYYQILDTERESMFDDLTQMASDVLEVPVCFITLLDEHRQWFKSSHGVDISETPREVSFCQYVVMQTSFFEVHDLKLDERFSYFPSVNDAPGFRYYGGFPLIDEKGAVIGALCALDFEPGHFSEKKQSAMATIATTVMNLIALRREKIEVKNLALVKDQFLANMSDEIRTPLNAILGFNNLLGGTPLSPEQTKYLDTIKTASLNLKAIIDDVLEVSKMENGLVQLEERPISLRYLIESVTEFQQPMAHKKGVSLIHNHDHNIPDFVYGDKTRLFQILTNLISNAIKFTDEGYISVSSKLLKVKRDVVKVSFKVKDTGIGIPKEYHKAIFDHFSQVESSIRRQYGGTGLGLSIVKSLVKIHKGEISVRSRPDMGSEFEVCIAFKIAQEVRNPDKMLNINSYNDKVLQNVKILLVEDNTINQMLAKKIIGRWGGLIDIAQNGQVAINFLERKSYDVIIMDLQMPIMDGLTAAKVIRQRLKLDVPIIGCSAGISNRSDHDQLKRLMNDFIDKPYTEEELVTTLVKYTKNRHDSDDESSSDNGFGSLLFEDIDELVEDIKSDGDDEFTQLLVNRLEQRIPKEIREVEEALDSRDMYKLIEKSQFLTRRLGAFGLEKGRELSKATYTSAKIGKWEEAHFFGNKLVRYLNHALHQLQ